MQKHKVGAVTSSISAAVAVLLFVLGNSAASAESHSQAGRSSVSSGRQAGKSVNRMGRSVRASRPSARGGRYDRGGKRGWFSRNRGYQNRSYIGFGSGSNRRSSFFFGYSFTWSEYRRSSGPRYRRDVRTDYRSDVPRQKNSSAQRAAIEHSPVQSGSIYVPLIASPAAPEVLPLKD